MNHPDIETCKKIASEFPESELVFASRRDSVCERQKIIAREELGDCLRGYTCEVVLAHIGGGDLQWVLCFEPYYHPENGKVVFEKEIGLGLDEDISETQARAEAVKILLSNDTEAKK